MRIQIMNSKQLTAFIALVSVSYLMAQDSPVVNSASYSKVYAGKEEAFEKAVTAHVSKWHGVFGKRLLICFFDDMINDEPQFIEGVCTWLDLDKKQIDDGRTKVQNKSMIYRSKGLQRMATTFDSMFSGVWHYLPWLKWPFSGLYNLVNAKPHNETLSDSLRAELTEYYQEDMHKTRDFLKERQIENLPGWLSN